MKIIKLYYIVILHCCSTLDTIIGKNNTRHDQLGQYNTVPVGASSLDLSGAGIDFRCQNLTSADVRF